MYVVVPMTDYYIIAGIVYQAPDLISIINSRLVRLWLTYFNWSVMLISVV